jgi:hypothetical protein
LTGDIDARLGHDSDGERVDSSRLRAGGVRFENLAFEGARPPFGHLAATEIAGAEKEHLQHFLCCRHEVMGCDFRLPLEPSPRLV